MAKSNFKRMCQLISPTKKFSDSFSSLICLTVDGVWLLWSTWSQCDSTCGQGRASRNRICTQPKYGGRDCKGDEREGRGCRAQNQCPGKFGTNNLLLSKKQGTWGIAAPRAPPPLMNVNVILVQIILLLLKNQSRWGTPAPPPAPPPWWMVR